MTSTVSSLKNIQRILYLSLGLLMLAEIAWLLNNFINYLFVVVIAAIFFAVHWFTRKNSKMKKWRKYLSLAIPVITVLAPLLYILYILFSESSAFWLYVAMFIGFIMPLLLMMYAIYSLQKMITSLQQVSAAEADSNN